MIKEIREYFTQAIYEADPDLLSHEEYFTSENIPDNALENSYFLKFGPLTSAYEDISINGEIDVSLEMWKNGYNDLISNLDSAYTKAIEIQALIMNRSRLNQLDATKMIEGIGIIPEPINDNGNLAKFTLQFKITVKYRDI